MTPLFWTLVVVVITATIGCVAYIKLKIEPVTEEWAHFLETIRIWRTQGFAAIVGLLGFAEVIDPGAIITVFGPESKGWVTIVIAACIYLLRLITDTPRGGISPPRGGGPAKKQ